MVKIWSKIWFQKNQELKFKQTYHVGKARKRSIWLKYSNLVHQEGKPRVLHSCRQEMMVARKRVVAVEVETQTKQG